MRVLLVSANTEKINMPVLPLGLACVAEAVRYAGHDVRFIDLMDQQDTRIVLENAIDDFQPEIIGISVRNIDDQCMEKPVFLLDSVKDFVNNCRSLSDAPIILGGAGYSIFPESALAYLGADMGIQGEGEIAFTILLERLSRKADLSGIPGLYLQNKGIQGKVRFTKDLNECPLPLPGDQEWTSFSNQNEEMWLPFQTRRGCPLNCSYCSTPTIEGKIMRKHSPASVVNAISRYVEAGFDRFFFVDNIFNLPPSYAKEFCDQLLKSGLNTSWRCILYPRKVDEELVQKMADAGCKEVSLGFESGSEKILRALNKNFQPEDIRLISERLKRYGILRMGFSASTITSLLKVISGFSFSMHRYNFSNVFNFMYGQSLHEQVSSVGTIKNSFSGEFFCIWCKMPVSVATIYFLASSFIVKFNMAVVDPT